MSIKIAIEILSYFNKNEYIRLVLSCLITKNSARLFI